MRNAYGSTEYPTHGPRLLESNIMESPPPIVSLKFDRPISYDQSEISGFYYCCLDYEECDKDAGAWFDFMKGDVEQVDPKVINIKTGNLIGWCEMEVPHEAYLWQQTPIKGYLNAPIYSTD